MTDDPLNSTRWRRKTESLVGLADPEATVRFQVLNGRVYVLSVHPDGSTARGEVELSFLESLCGGSVTDGWYDDTGRFLGTDVDFDSDR